MFSSVSGWTPPGVGPPVRANGAPFSLPDQSLPMDLSFKLGVYPSTPSDVSVYRYKLGVPCGRVSSRDPRLFRRPMSDVATLPPVSGEMPKPELVQVFSDLMQQVAAAPLPSSDEEEEVVSPRSAAASNSEQVVSPSRQTEVAPTDTQDKTEVNPAAVALPSSDSESGSEYISGSDSDDDKECTSSSSGSTCSSSSCAKCNGSDSSSDSDSDNSSSNSSRSSSDSSSSSSSEDEDSSSKEDDVSDHPTEEVDHSPSLGHKSGPSAETSPCSSGSPASSAYGSSSGSSSGSAASPSCSSGYGSATPGTSSSVTHDPDFEKRLTITRYGPQVRGLRVWYNEDESDDSSSDSDNEPVLPPPAAPVPYTGKGKGKSTKRRKVDDLVEPFSRLSIGPPRPRRSVAPRRLLRCFGKLDITEPPTTKMPTKRKACYEEDSEEEHQSRKKRRAEQRRYVELVREIFGADSDDETPVETPRKRRHVCKRRKAASASETAPALPGAKKVRV
ncbi:clumping factor B-like [Haliotis rubra]|uniref:clumping factor B-like n=1 Tax=Haliotis rubra TaxID=36100 RepID=UPI001EE54667|nr:clumping factor B-like [Haliotis rubra]